MNKNDLAFNQLADSMVERINNTTGERYSGYLYTLGAKTNGLNANIMFSPQADLMISRILIADSQDLLDTKFDAWFVTDMSGSDFAQLNFNVSKDKLFALQSIVFDLTQEVDSSENWQTTVSYSKLERYLADHDFSKAARSADTAWAKTHDITEVVDSVVDTIGMKEARSVIPKAYVVTPLANLWFQSLKQLKLFLDSRHLVGNDMSKMNFGNKEKSFKRFTK